MIGKSHKCPPCIPHGLQCKLTARGAGPWHSLLCISLNVAKDGLPTPTSFHKRPLGTSQAGESCHSPHLLQPLQHHQAINSLGTTADSISAICEKLSHAASPLPLPQLLTSNGYALMSTNTPRLRDASNVDVVCAAPWGCTYYKPLARDTAAHTFLSLQTGTAAASTRCQPNAPATAVN